MSIPEWLQQLGVGRYETVFSENEIDWDVLPELIERDLERMGLPLGPRNKIARAIAALATPDAQRTRPSV